MPPQASVIEVTWTRSSGQAHSSRNSSHDMTSPACAVVVVMKKRFSDRRVVVPSSSATASSFSITP